VSLPSAIAPSRYSTLGAVARGVAAIGRPVNALLAFIGALAWLAADTAGCFWQTAVLRQARYGFASQCGQIVRIGARSVPVTALVCACIGLILALQMAPPLEPYGQLEQVPVIIAIAVVRELGPLISAIVLTGFAGASIAAEIGTMVVGEEIEALRAHALNPIRFLVMPRIVATVLCLAVLSLVGDVVAVGSGWAAGVGVLNIPSRLYLDNSINALDLADLFTGLFKSGIFGLLIGLIACYNGLSVTGGAAGVGRATTRTVVYCIVCIIVTVFIFTSLFYALHWT
jgi:phospholipid/cholesterol/gamma-HCH transport system permease protein